MPQLDIQTYLSTVTYVMVLFLGLVFFVYYIIVPKLSERLKARNLLETKVILPEGENETLNRITEEHKVISLLIEKKKDTLLQSGHIILGISVKTTLIYLTLYLMLAALLINPELIVISGFFIVFIIILVNLAKNLNTWLLEIIKQQENKGVAIFTEQVQQTKTSLNNVEREMRLIHQIPRLTVSFTEVLEEKMICETNEITAHIARNLKDILEKSLRMENAVILRYLSDLDTETRSAMHKPFEEIIAWRQKAVLDEIYQIVLKMLEMNPGIKDSPKPEIKDSPKPEIKNSPKPEIKNSPKQKNKKIASKFPHTTTTC